MILGGLDCLQAAIFHILSPLRDWHGLYLPIFPSWSFYKVLIYRKLRLARFHIPVQTESMRTPMSCPTGPRRFQWSVFLFLPGRYTKPEARQYWVCENQQGSLPHTYKISWQGYPTVFPACGP